jgi:multiple sugar transport system ATP-binding protein
MLGLGELLDRKPGALSGGQRQRVAMGRAIVREPQVFLMDEPLSNLDAKLRTQTRTEIADLQRRLGTTTIYVTHDQVEAMTMGDRVAVLRAGVLQQVDAPKAVYAQPANTFVAGFIGSPAMGLYEVPLVADGKVELGRWSFDASGRAGQGELAGLQSVVVGVRPEDWRHASEADGLPVRVTLVEDLGADIYVHGLAEIGGDSPGVTFRETSGKVPAKGDLVHLAPEPSKVHLFSPETQQRLRPDVR